MTAFGNPPRMSLTNLLTSETLTAQFNPQKLDESLDINYARQTIPGMSHQVIQYVNTNNVKWEGVELFFIADDPLGFNTLHRARTFIHSLLLPPGGAESVVGGAPPRVLFVWPHVLAVSAVITSAKFSHEMFKSDGRTRIMRVFLTLEEIRDVRITSEDMRSDVEGRFGDVRYEEV